MLLLSPGNTLVKIRSVGKCYCEHVHFPRQQIGVSSVVWQMLLWDRSLPRTTNWCWIYPLTNVTLITGQPICPGPFPWNNRCNLFVQSKWYPFSSYILYAIFILVFIYILTWTIDRACFHWLMMSYLTHKCICLCFLFSWYKFRSVLASVIDTHTHTHTHNATISSAIFVVACMKIVGKDFSRTTGKN